MGQNILDHATEKGALPCWYCQGIPNNTVLIGFDLQIINSLMYFYIIEVKQF
jgi:hypothetical protein